MFESKILAALTLLVANGTCGEQNDESGEIVDRDACTKLCSLVLCDGVTEVGEDYVGSCADRCTAKGSSADDIGAECAVAFSRSVLCVSELECSDYLRWDDGDETICEDSLSMFTEHCPDLTFDFRE